MKDMLQGDILPIETDSPERQKALHDEYQQILDKLLEIQTILNSDNLVWDLCDPSGFATNCTDNLKRVAMDEVLIPGTTYSMAKKMPPDEKGNVIYFPFLFDITPPSRGKTPS
eukprot:CAMPEP_0182429062 /NCGR_PEP_ID=MMETSP1167-20130531/25484_1 /TAXON_ID=2988 /ORGANISM="Mallomonas Sp, Strain CCMP3275" /LENGTH=112 /DNA_ID=CAMNT_0024612371 /DNA_START=392 /DNA_END=726 /DNA_ORIENTATION=+